MSSRAFLYVTPSQNDEARAAIMRGGEAAKLGTSSDSILRRTSLDPGRFPDHQRATSIGGRPPWSKAASHAKTPAIFSACPAPLPGRERANREAGRRGGSRRDFLGVHADDLDSPSASTAPRLARSNNKTSPPSRLPVGFSCSFAHKSETAQSVETDTRRNASVLLSFGAPAPNALTRPISRVRA